MNTREDTPVEPEDGVPRIEGSDMPMDPVAERRVNGGAMATRALLLLALAVAAAGCKKEEPSDQSQCAETCPVPTLNAGDKPRRLVMTDIVDAKYLTTLAKRIRTFEPEFVNKLDIAPNGELTPEALQQMKDFVASKVGCNPADLKEVDIPKRPGFMLFDRMLAVAPDEICTSKGLNLNGRDLEAIAAAYHSGKDVAYYHQVPLNATGDTTESKVRQLWPDCVVIEKYELYRSREGEEVSRIQRRTFETGGKMPFLDSVELVDSQGLERPDDPDSRVIVGGKIWRDKNNSKNIFAVISIGGGAVYASEEAKKQVLAAQKFLSDVANKGFYDHSAVSGNPIELREGEELVIDAKGVHKQKTKEQ